MVENGYDPEYGARPVKRLIQRELVNQLAKATLEGRIRRAHASRSTARTASPC